MLEKTRRNRRSRRNNNGENPPPVWKMVLDKELDKYMKMLRNADKIMDPQQRAVALEATEKKWENIKKQTAKMAVEKLHRNMNAQSLASRKNRKNRKNRKH